MKKLLAFLLVAAVLCAAALTLTVSADPVNAKYDVKFTSKSPQIDGVVENGEYSKYPLVEFGGVNDHTDEFLLNHYEITDDNLSFEFYATWDVDNFYMAWVVHTSYDFRIPDEEFAAVGGDMWKYCCVQFIITPGAPNAAEKKYQTSEWSGDYLEVGLTLRNDGKSSGVCWSQPSTAHGEFGPNDWEFAGSRDEKKNITTYEVRVPFVKSGIATKGDDAQFGLTFAVAAQEHYEKKVHGMVEWQDAILNKQPFGGRTGKNADQSAVMTMVGSGMKQEPVSNPEGREEGKLPSGLNESILKFNYLNKAIETDMSALLTDLSSPITGFNTTWSYCMLLRPAEKIKELDGYYTIVDTYPGDGTMTELTFGTEIKEGDVVAVFHGDAGQAGAPRKELAASLPVGQKLYLFGFERIDGTASFKYSNAQLCIIEDPAAPLYNTTWIVEEGGEEHVVTFSSKEEMTVTINGETKPFTMSDKGALKIDGKKATWEISEDGKLTLDGKTFEKVGEADTEKLNSLITSAEALKEEDYTPETFAAVKTALEAAKAKLAEALDSRNQEEIEALSDALENAVKALEKKPEESAEESAPAENSAEESAPEESQQAEESQTPAESSETEKPAEGGLPWWAWLLICGGAALVICVIVVIIVKSKKK